jgi:fatty-acyl-CoA synthase
MQETPLSLASLCDYGERIRGESLIVSLTETGTRRMTLRDTLTRARKLAAALSRLGLGVGDRVATFAWNTQEHLEVYYALPAMGAVLHTLNIRLSVDQLAFIIEDAGDQVIVCDAHLFPLLAPVLARTSSVKHVIVYGASEAPEGTLDYEALVTAGDERFTWPILDERSPAQMCYTSGTTGNPKGIVQSHRANVLHAYAVAACFGLSERDRVLPCVPMFHANAWGLPHATLLTGANLLLPGRFMQAEPIARIFNHERPTFAAGVPTIWIDLARHAETAPLDTSALRLVVSGGAAVPRALTVWWRNRSVPLLQAWGMTETGPLSSLAEPLPGATGDLELDQRARAGRPVPGVELRICDDAGVAQPWDDVSQGEVEIRGPWVTARYHGVATPDRFHDGWLRTGDVGTIDRYGSLRIADRTKDLIKSGGEWISSVDLEGVLLGHPGVAEAAVIAIPDQRYSERPLACVVPRAEPPTLESLRQYLAERVPPFWVPEHFAFVAAIPRTGVGKFDKKVLRARHAAGELEVQTVVRRAAATGTGD